MPATLPAGASFPVAVPPVDPRFRRRSMPPELAPFERDDTPLGLAIRRLARDIYHPDEMVAEREDTFRHRLVDAINVTGQAAFTPRTSISYLSADQVVNATGWADLTGMEQLIVTPVPARIYVMLSISASVTAEGDDKFEIQVDGSGSATPFSYAGVMMPALGIRNFQWTVTSQDIFDAIPRTLYTLTPQAQFKVGGIAEFNIIEGATFTVRVEPRSLREQP